MSKLKSHINWLAALVVVILPLLSACGAETPTATPVPAPTDTPAAAAPKQDVQAATDTKLAATGPANVLVPAGIATSLGYAGNMLRLKRRTSQNR